MVLGPRRTDLLKYFILMRFLVFGHDDEADVVGVAVGVEFTILS